MRDVQTTSNMVADGVSPSAIQLESTAQYPLIATCAIPPDRLFPIAKWAPRSGFGEQYEAWWRNVKQLLAAYGLTPADMEAVPASYSPLPTSPGAHVTSPAGFSPPGGMAWEEWWMTV